VEALLDTGFDGDIVIPPHQRYSSWELSPLDTCWWFNSHGASVPASCSRLFIL